MDLTREALLLIEAVFGPKSNVQMPASVAASIIEIRQWVHAQLEMKTH